MLCSAAVALAESIRYSSAGTIEYLVDDESGDFFFLEMKSPGIEIRPIHQMSGTRHFNEDVSVGAAVPA